MERLSAQLWSQSVKQATAKAVVLCHLMFQTE